MKDIISLNDKKLKEVAYAIQKIVEIQGDLDHVVLIGTKKSGECVLFTSPMFLRDQALVAAYLNAYVSARFGIEPDL